MGALAKLLIPEVVYPNDARLPPHELRVYRVRVIIDQVKTESDGDWHLILRDPADPTSALIAEIPAPACAKNTRNA